MNRRVRNSRVAGLLAVTALALGVAACGSDDEDGGASSTTSTPSSTAASSAPTSESTSTTSAGESSAPADAAATKVVATPMGEVEVPTDPQRIVVLWGATLSSVVQLGFEPVAAFGRDGDNSNLAPYLPEGYPLDTLAVVAAPREVNFEAVTAVQPDLILGGDVPHLAESYDQLSAIAPTVLLSWEGTASWRTMLTDVADVLGVPERAAEAVQQYEAHVADVREVIGLDENPMTLSVVRIQSPEEIRVETPASFSGQIIADVGFTRPDNQLQPDADADYISLSLERIPEVDASTIVALYYFNDGDTSAAWDQIRTSPLWQALPAVQAGRVVEADFTNWSSSNYYAAHQVLDDIAAAFGS